MESGPSGLQRTAGAGQIETRFVIYVDGDYFGEVRNLLSSLNEAMAGFGTPVRVGVAVPVGTITVSGQKNPTAEEKTKMAGILENGLRESLRRSGKDWPVTVNPEARTGAI